MTEKPKREPVDLGKWFPIARKLKVTCCQCGMKHTYFFRAKRGKYEMKVTP